MAHVITLNAGSSSIKFALFAVAAAGPHAIAIGLAETIGEGQRIRVKAPDGTIGHEESWQGGAPFHAEAMGRILDWRARTHPEAEIVAAGHRVVHGGLAFDGPILLDPAALAALEPWCRWHRCTSRTIWRGFAPRRRPGPAYPRWPASIPPSTVPIPM